jgi:carbonic anhydrase
VVAGVASWVLPAWVRKKLLNVVMRPFKEEEGSVREDVWLLRHAPLMPAGVPIFGLVYDVQNGTLRHVATA